MFERSGAVPSRPSIKARRRSRVLSGAATLFIGMLPAGPPAPNRKPRFLTAQAGCIPTHISSNAMPSPSPPPITAPRRAATTGIAPNWISLNARYQSIEGYVVVGGALGVELRKVHPGAEMVAFAVDHGSTNALRRLGEQRCKA